MVDFWKLSNTITFMASLPKVRQEVQWPERRFKQKLQRWITAIKSIISLT
jgi:hypothetical protein